MKQLIELERFFLIGHIVSMAFGLVGLLFVLPNAELILSLSAPGQVLFQWGMAGGGVVYIILGAVAVAIYAYRTLGLWHWLTFMLPAIFLSLSSELLGTSTGFPFGHYAYLSGLGYKIAGLVPFTIPLSWFYLGIVSYVIARVGLSAISIPGWMRASLSIAIGALLLTSWDFVLDPAMSQTAVPFWQWQQPGAFFGMPYQNFAGWMGTGAVFMSVAALFWSRKPISFGEMTRSQLNFPIAIYFSNFAFAALMSIAAGFWVPVILGVFLGILPVVVLWGLAKPETVEQTAEPSPSLTAEIPLASVKVALK